jgi:hypothetical protein
MPFGFFGKRINYFFLLELKNILTILADWSNWLWFILNAHLISILRKVIVVLL